VKATFERADEAAAFVLSRTPLRPRVGVVLGSGLGTFAEGLGEPVRIPYEEIPHFPRATAISHAGRLVVGRVSGVAVAAMQGRVHQYEGYSAEETAFPVRVLSRMGVRALVLTNAAGGIDVGYATGALVVLRDHINLTGRNPLAGPHDERLGARFPDMSAAYTRRYREIALDEASRLGIPPRTGVYAGVLGPSFETPAEIRFLRVIGAADGVQPPNAHNPRSCPPPRPPPASAATGSASPGARAGRVSSARSSASRSRTPAASGRASSSSLRDTRASRWTTAGACGTTSRPSMRSRSRTWAR